MVNITAATPPPGKAFAGWTGDTATVANPSSANTTVTMPDGAVTLTATYDWARGHDLVRFFTLEGSEHRVLNCIFEGSNGDPVTGPYTPFYVVPAIPPPGWTEINVNLGNYRYLRFRDPETNGMIAEIEFHRNGRKLTGTGFGTPGSWGNEPHRTFAAALDGDTTTFFNGPAGRNTYVGIDSLGVSAAAKTLTVNGGSGSGRYDVGTTVPVAADPPVAGQEFKGWEGDTVILSNPFVAATTAMMPSLDVAITATYRPLAVAPTLLRAALRRNHGGGNVVDFAVFGADSTSNVEGRLANAGGAHDLRLEFDQEVTAGRVVVEAGTAKVSSVQVSGRTAAVALRGVSDRQKVTLRLVDWSNGNSPAMAPTPLAIRFLRGDANRDGIVNSVDLANVRGAYGKSWGQAGYSAAADIKPDGFVNAGDVINQRNNSGRSVSP